MTHQSLLVSAIIPVYNQERFLSGAIESVQEQSYKPIELLVIDDGSTDQSAQIARRFKGIRFIQQENQGVSAARNRGISQAKGEFIAFLDSDDLWYREKIRQQVDYFSQHTHTDVLFCKYHNFVESGIELPPWVNIERFLDERVGSMPTPSTLMVRKSVFDQVGQFNPEYKTGEDLDWFARMKDAGISLDLLSEELVSRRLHDANLSYQARRDHSNLFQIFKSSIERKKHEK